MRIDQAALSALIANPFTWSANWAWGVPLILLTVVIHVWGLAIVGQKTMSVCNGTGAQRHPKVTFVVATGATTLVATFLHGIEAGVWAAAYQLHNLLPDFGSSMLYSLNAMTTYGQTTLDVDSRWRLLGALEALNGWLLFGLTTAFLFAVIQKLWQGNK